MIFNSDQHKDGEPAGVVTRLRDQDKKNRNEPPSIKDFHWQLETPSSEPVHIRNSSMVPEIPLCSYQDKVAKPIESCDDWGAAGGAML
jgi:hypothetical protein